MTDRSIRLIAAAALSSVAGSGAALAQHADNGVSLLAAKSPVAAEVHVFHNYVLMPVMVGISVFVLALILWVAFRYNSKANPTPRRFSHNTLIEIIWTGVPVLILLFIALFSFDLLYKEDVTPDGKRVVTPGDGVATEFAFANDFAERRRVTRPEHLDVRIVSGDGERRLRHGADYRVTGLGEDAVTVALKSAPATGEQVLISGGRSRVGPAKFLGLFGEDRSEVALAPTMTLVVTGYQWGWTYSYPDFGGFEITSNMAPDTATTPELYRLAVDYPIYVPAGETIRVVTTGRDVIHSWALPNFALKIDAVPGRHNEAWFAAPEAGTYYGQCSEICGVKHSFMPIEVRAAPRDQFMTWVNDQREASGMEPIGIAAVDGDRNADDVAGAASPSSGR